MTEHSSKMERTARIIADDEPIPQVEGRYVLLGATLRQLQELIKAQGFPAFRARQLYHWMYHRCARDFSEMHNISKEFRRWLEDNATLGHITILDERLSKDGSRKFVFQLYDGRLVESVLIKEEGWNTLCVSSQVGCAVGCTFCLTGFGGYQRQMTRAEIVSQVLTVKRLLGEDELLRNLVFMGMGEPMLNLDEIIPALRVLTDPEGVAIAARRVTVSTSGIIPGIRRLGEADLGVSLAVSLNATKNSVRDVIMPINKVYPIEDLLEACRQFPLRPRRRITFEYVLLRDINDSVEDARQLARLLKGIPCKINLIPFNPDSRLPFDRPSPQRVEAFQQVLLDKHYTASIRYSKGLDIGGACGQLAAHWRDGRR